MNVEKLMAEAQKMQAKMQEAQKNLENLTVSGKAGGGLVEVVMRGDHQVIKTILAKDIFDECDAEMLADLMTAAFNDAVGKVKKETERRIKELTAGIDLPPGL
jgi:nucleoid-associated protein EbfC